MRFSCCAEFYRMKVNPALIHGGLIALRLNGFPAWESSSLPDESTVGTDREIIGALTFLVSGI